MKTIKRILSIVLVGLTLTSCLAQENMVEEFNKTITASSQSDCEKKGGYWYNNKCWANFNDFDDGISVEEIDSEVEKQLKAAEGFELNLDDISYKIDFFFPESNAEDKEFLILTLFTDKGISKSLFLTTSLKNAEKEKFPASAMLFSKNLMELSEKEESNIQSYIIAQGEVKVTSSGDEDDRVFNVAGSLFSINENKEMSLNMTVGMALMGIGNTTLEVKGNEAYLNGTLGTKGYVQFKELIKNHPEVRTIVLQNVPGSVNDAVNMHTGRIIREAGLHTKVLANSRISSGGVDLFCSGKERIVTKGAHLGIHSWGGDGLSAHQVPKDHPAHQYQLAYFTMCLGKEKGPGFYFRTLEAAPADDMHWMSDDELKKWDVATQLIESKSAKSEHLYENTNVNQNDLTGKWKLKSIYRGGENISPHEMFGTSSVFQEYSAQGEFKSYIGNDIIKGTWQIFGNTIKVNSKADNSTFKVREFKKDKMILELDGFILNYEKQ